MLLYIEIMQVLDTVKDQRVSVDTALYSQTV